MKFAAITGAMQKGGSAVLLALLFACADEGVVGENAIKIADGGVSVVSVPDDDPCVREQMQSALPLFTQNYPVGPAFWVEAARGTWSNANGDVLEVKIDEANKLIERTCYEASTPASSVPLPEVKFELEGEITLRSADGAWNETVAASFALALAPPAGSTELRDQLSGNATVTFAEFRGTFRLPSDLPGHPADAVQLGLTYLDLGWVLSRSVYTAPPDGGLRGGLPGQVWRDQLAFTKR